MAKAGTPLNQRHDATRHLMMTLQPSPRVNGAAVDVAQIIWDAAGDMLMILDDGPELTAGLRLLRQAKDCLVIQGLIDAALITAGPSG